MSDLILYTTEDGKSQIKLRADQQTIWLTQLEMAELPTTMKPNRSPRRQNIFEDSRLYEGSVVKESLTAGTGVGATATVKQSLTVRIAQMRRPTAEESSVVQIRNTVPGQWRSCHG